MLTRRPARMQRPDRRQREISGGAIGINPPILSSHPTTPPAIFRIPGPGAAPRRTASHLRLPSVVASASRRALPAIYTLPACCFCSQQMHDRPVARYRLSSKLSLPPSFPTLAASSPHS
ncbi:hypothetical protein FA95DRAFT_1560139 [Auriscalpium vulgare]|uniref:Uncharacterized protein n=1 Tax=Auriscalpium vulgare TaxID=40419 RepID=A0ACB8RQI5_9AGAM|nr:hypothetical protein FA95DRAFT_1560139 [Auriscalpium vulgare]